MIKINQRILKSSFTALLVMLTSVATASLSADVSVVLGGGLGQYQFTQHRNAFDVYSKLYPGGVLSFPSSDLVQNVATMEGITPVKYEGRERKAFAELEYYVGQNKVLSFTGGISYTEGKQMCLSNCGDIDRANYLVSVAKNVLSLPQDQQLLASYIYYSRPELLDRDAMKSKHTLIDLGLNFHLNPNGSVDPYLGAVGGFGVCSVSSTNVDACTAFKYGGRFGLRFNFSKVLFLNVQAGLNRVEYNLTKKSGITLAETALSSVKMKIPTPERELLVGIGLNL
ncbi:MAG: hypothetical protein H3C43_01585 [Leptonema sp. (in: Bacteria)]|nr:hypothetical protein [Leptonema sp. (in: bacteria)]